jgi:enoyl-CoA hydratase/carnithine racemase
MPDVIYERTGRIGRITFDRPAKLNALTDWGIQDLAAALYAFDDDEDAWVGVVSGNGRAFSTGADVNQRQNRTPEEIKKLGGLQPRGIGFRDGFLGQVRMKPLIAAVHGYALGMGLRIAMYCDLFVAAVGTTFQITEVPRGVDAVGFWMLLADRLGSAFADDVCVTGRRWMAEEPESRALFTRLAPSGEHLAVAEELAEMVASNPPLAVRNIIRARRAHLAQIELDSEAHADRTLVHTEDFREAVRAHLERRPPVFHGR